MTEYRPLALKNTTAKTADGDTVKVKVGSMAYANLGEMEVRLRPMARDSKSFRVEVKMAEGSKADKWLIAGHLFHRAIGLYEISSNSFDGSTGEVVVKGDQGRGYTQQGKMADCAERVVGEFVGSLDYAERDARGEIEKVLTVDDIVEQANEEKFVITNAKGAMLPGRLVLKPGKGLLAVATTADGWTVEVEVAIDLARRLAKGEAKEVLV